MDNEDLADRLILEQMYDRPSFHCGTWAHRLIGRLSAIMDKHIAEAHQERIDRGLGFFDYRCELCGFDCAAELHRLYPDLVNEGDVS